MRYLVLDTEHGGKGGSLLDIYAATFDENGKLLRDIELSVRPPGGLYVVNPEAMEVNKINLLEHSKKAKPVETCRNEFSQFLKHSACVKATPYIWKGQTKFNYEYEKLCLVGHGVKEDAKLIRDVLGFEFGWDSYVQHTPQDTCVIAKFLKDCGRLPPWVGLSLEDLGNYFLISFGELHSAREDAILNFKVFQSLKKRIGVCDPIDVA